MRCFCTARAPNFMNKNKIKNSHNKNSAFAYTLSENTKLLDLNTWALHNHPQDWVKVRAMPSSASTYP